MLQLLTTLTLVGIKTLRQVDYTGFAKRVLQREKCTFCAKLKRKLTFSFCFLPKTYF